MKKIDFHAHVLPGCDHGSDGLSTSLRQLELAKKAGVDLICATSHFYAEREDVSAYLARRSKCFKALEQALGESTEIHPEILCGAEVLAFAGIERLPGLERLCLEGTNILLLEMPFTKWPEAVVDSVMELLDNPEYRIVLAHAERYDAENIEQLLAYDAKIQCNAGILSHVMLQRSVRSWLDREFLVAMGSDIHGTGGAYDVWSRAEKIHPGVCSKIFHRTSRLLESR